MTIYFKFHHTLLAQYVEHHLTRQGYNVHRNGAEVTTTAAEQTVRNIEKIALRKGIVKAETPREPFIDQVPYTAD